MRYRYQCECGLTFDGRPNKDGEILPSNQVTDLSEPIRPMLCEKCLRRDPAKGVASTEMSAPAISPWSKDDVLLEVSQLAKRLRDKGHLVDLKVDKWGDIETASLAVRLDGL